MDLTQSKLSKIEWNMIEIPVSEQEKSILQLIIDGYENLSICKNNTETMMSFIKISYSEDMEKTLYKTFFESEIRSTVDKFSKGASSVGAASDFIAAVGQIFKSEVKTKIRRSDSIRMENISENINSNKENIFEFIQIDFCKKVLKYLAGAAIPTPSAMEAVTNTRYAYYLYTLIHTNKSKIALKNRYVEEYVAAVIAYATATAGINLYRHILENAQDFIEKNKYIIQYADMELYEHQRRLFSVFKDPRTVAGDRSNLVLYLAPTGTGKTMSPLGLSQKYRVIFVCVARHVGLALAKSAISMGKRIAFAFGCETAGDIRLHYFAAKEYTKNYRSGMIYKVDNSVGDKVEIMICDIKSYLCAMNYMTAFHPLHEIVTYWDEPTITLDVETHELHDTIARNWRENRIPNVVLSCATLPREEEIMETIEDFRSRFANAEIHTIASFETKKSVTLINKSGFVVTPHTLFREHARVIECTDHIQKTRSLLKYLDLKEIARFIVFVADRGFITRENLRIDQYFDSISEITMSNIKEYYLKLLKLVARMPDAWNEIYTFMESTRDAKISSASAAAAAAAKGSVATQIQKMHSFSAAVPAIQKESGAPLARQNTIAVSPAATSGSSGGILLTTADAYTLTDGPTIYLAEDVNKIARFYLQQSNIPEVLLARISALIEHNNKVNRQIEKHQKNIEDATAKDVEKENKMSSDHRLPQNVQLLMSEIDALRRRIQPISLDDVYIPNSLAHQSKWAGKITPNAFTSDIDEQTVEEIANLTNVSNSFKILLLMGVGVFMQHESIEYMEIMKKLAYQQKLYMIIASSDFIYGTNYQFCHAIIGKDLCLTQQKAIQAIGRVGRNNIQQDYTVRFREDQHIQSLFQPAAYNLEAENMRRLFVSA